MKKHLSLIAINILLSTFSLSSMHNLPYKDRVAFYIQQEDLKQYLRKHQYNVFIEAKKEVEERKKMIQMYEESNIKITYPEMTLDIYTQRSYGKPLYTKITIPKLTTKE